MSSRRLVHKLHEFVKIQGRVEKAPGFSAALGLDHESLFNHGDVITVDTNGVTLRYPVTTERLLPNSSAMSLSTYLAVIDDVTTWALVLGDEKRSRPGKSVSLNLWAGPSAMNGRRPGDEVNIVATVKKIGRNLGFCGAEIRDTASGDLVCFGSHVKYLPMGLLFDTALSSYGWKAATLYAQHFLSEPLSNAPPLTDLFDSLREVSETTATFDVEPIHASLGGPIHGGCQAVLMEMVATHVAEKHLGSHVALDSIQVEYMSPPSSKTVELVTELVPYSETTSDGLTMRVKLIGDAKTKSEGILQFSKA